MFLPQCQDFFPHILGMQNHIGHELSQGLKIVGPHSKAGHLRHTQAQGAGGRESLFLRRRLKIADHVVLFQLAGDAGPLGIPDLDDDLVGLCEVHGRIAGHLQAAGVKRFGKSFGVGDYRRLVVILEGVHFHGGRQQSQQGAQVMVADGAGECPPGNGLPEFEVAVLVRSEIGGHNTALGAEKRFVR